MKKAIIILSIFICSFSILYAEDNNRLQVITTDYPPFQMINEEGEVSGMAVEIVQAIVNEAGLEADIEIYPWSRARRILNTDPNTLFFNLTRTEIRENMYHWIADITPTDIYIWKNEYRHDIVIEDFNDLNLHNIGVLPDTVQYQYLRDKGILESRFYIFQDDNQQFQMLSKNRIDLLPLNEYIFTYLVKQSGLSLDQFERTMFLPDISSKAYLVASLNTSETIVNRLITSWTNVKKNGVYESILNKYLK